MDENQQTELTGEDVLNLRVALGLTQEQLAELLGVSKKTAYNWEARDDGSIPAAASRKIRNLVVHKMFGPKEWDVLSAATRGRLMKLIPAEGERTSRRPVTANGPEDDVDETRRELAVALLAAKKRAVDFAASKSPDEMAQLHLEFVDAAVGALDFAERALELGGDGMLVELLSTTVVNLIIDTGTYQLASQLKSVDVHARVLERSTLLNKAAREAKLSSDRDPFLMTWDGKFAQEADTAADPDYSKMSDQDAYDLAANKGEANIGHDEIPNEP